MIGAVQAYISIYLLTAGGPANSTQVILTYAYEEAFSFFNFGYAGAIATLMGIVLLAATIMQLRLFRRRWNSG